MCSLDFSEILCDDRHLKGIKSDSFSFFRTTLNMPKTPWDVSGYKIDMLHISCFIALSFLMVLLLGTGVYGYFVLVC